MKGMFPFREKLFADSLIRGRYLSMGLPRSCRASKPRSSNDPIKPRIRAVTQAWIVKRTIAWLHRCRRDAKDWENLNRKALAFLKVSSIRLMLRKLCNP
jgi:hypothetical protein